MAMDSAGTMREEYGGGRSMSLVMTNAGSSVKTMRLVFSGLDPVLRYNPTGRMDMNDIVKMLQKEHDRIQHQADGIKAAIEALDGTVDGTGPSRKPGRGRKSGWHMSAAAKRRISLAQKARWAAKKK